VIGGFVLCELIAKIPIPMPGGEWFITSTACPLKSIRGFPISLFLFFLSFFVSLPPFILHVKRPNSSQLTPSGTANEKKYLPPRHQDTK